MATKELEKEKTHYRSGIMVALTIINEILAESQNKDLKHLYILNKILSKIIKPEIIDNTTNSIVLLMTSIIMNINNLKKKDK